MRSKGSRDRYVTMPGFATAFAIFHRASWESDIETTAEAGRDACFWKACITPAAYPPRSMEPVTGPSEPMPPYAHLPVPPPYGHTDDSG
jgi:hypothetical protein